MRFLSLYSWPSNTKNDLVCPTVVTMEVSISWHPFVMVLRTRRTCALSSNASLYRALAFVRTQNGIECAWNRQPLLFGPWRRSLGRTTRSVLRIFLKRISDATNHFAGTSSGDLPSSRQLRTKDFSSLLELHFRANQQDARLELPPSQKLTELRRGPRWTTLPDTPLLE